MYEEVACVSTPGSLAALDARGYLEANPEIVRAGFSAEEHFSRWGQAEGRIQFFNHDEVGALRDRKLKRVRFRRRPAVDRVAGAAANFLPKEVMEAFAIPDAPPVSANPYSEHLWEQIRASPDKLHLDVGAGLRGRVCSNVINTEIYPNISTDVLCVGEDLPFASDQFDHVFCFAVLEHTRRPWDVARELVRVTKPGGTLLIDWPFLQGVHGYPHHYFNATPQGVVSLFEQGCEILSSSVEPNNHPIQALWWLLATWRDGLAGEAKERFLGMSVGEILAAAPDVQLEGDFCSALSEEAKWMIPAGSTLLARKKEGKRVLF